MRMLLVVRLSYERQTAKHNGIALEALHKPAQSGTANRLNICSFDRQSAFSAAFLLHTVVDAIIGECPLFRAHCDEIKSPSGPAVDYIDESIETKPVCPGISSLA
jgi:hypothetical protein